MRQLLALILASLTFEQAFGQGDHPFFDVRVYRTPEVVIIDGKSTLYYELHLVSLASDSIVLNTLEAFNPADLSILFSAGKEELAKRWSKPGTATPETSVVMAPADSGVLYLEFALPNNRRTVQLAHRLTLEIIHGKERKVISVEGPRMTLSKEPPIILGAPGKAGIWAAVYDPSWERGHRRVIFTVDGKAYIPGRFAIDLIKLDAHGRYATGNEDSIMNWFGYGSEVLAVANGVVSSVRNDFPESPTLSGHPKYTADQATGNYVSINLGNNRFAFYEHLKPGSIKVKQGQKVKMGDIIASIGFTGQTTGPHLHLHISTSNSPLGAEGVPFGFDHFTKIGTYKDFGNFGKLPWMPVGGSHGLFVTHERPGPNSVVEFRRILRP